MLPAVAFAKSSDTLTGEWAAGFPRSKTMQEDIFVLYTWPTVVLLTIRCPRTCQSVRMRAHEAVACADGNARVLADARERVGHHGLHRSKAGAACCFGARLSRGRHASRARGARCTLRAQEDSRGVGRHCSAGGLRVVQFSAANLVANKNDFGSRKPKT